MKAKKSGGPTLEQLHPDSASNATVPESISQVRRSTGVVQKLIERIKIAISEAPSNRWPLNGVIQRLQFLRRLFHIELSFLSVLSVYAVTRLVPGRCLNEKVFLPVFMREKGCSRRSFLQLEILVAPLYHACHASWSRRDFVALSLIKHSICTARLVAN